MLSLFWKCNFYICIYNNVGPCLFVSSTKELNSKREGFKERFFLHSLTAALDGGFQTDISSFGFVL